jgi:hypothetical protein
MKIEKTEVVVTMIIDKWKLMEWNICISFPGLHPGLKYFALSGLTIFNHLQPFSTTFNNFQP